MDSNLLYERKCRRQKLRTIQEALDKLNCSQLSPTDLKELGIQRTSMTLNGDQRPVFFKPYESTIQNPDVDTLDDDYAPITKSSFCTAQSLAWYLSEYFKHCILPDEESCHPGTSYADWGDFNFGNLFNFTQGSRWQVKSTWHMPRSGAPHMVVLKFSELPEGEEPSELSRGEITTLIHVMHGRLRNRSLCPNVIAPVLLFSVVGMHLLRVIEAFHDGAQLVVRDTDIKDLAQPDHEFFITLSKWWLGYASSQSTKAI